MREWYEKQFVVFTLINILTLISIIVGETLSKKDFIYKNELMTITITILILSGILMLLMALYKK